MTLEVQTRPPLRWGGIVTAAVLGLTAFAVCGALGSWQWQRSQSQGQVVDPGPAVPLAEVMVPGDSATGIGRVVTVAGEWAQESALLVPGRHFDGHDATLVVVPLTVAADHSGTGTEATVAVLAGWLPPDAVPDDVVMPTGSVVIEGVLRGSEEMAPITELTPGGLLEAERFSTASLIGVWPAPVYSAVVTSAEPLAGWNAVPLPQPETRIDFRSLTYAGEWWLFGAFALFICARWIRDNGRRPSDDAPAGGGDVRE